MFIFTNENKNIRTNKFKYYYLVLFFLNLIHIVKQICLIIRKIHL